MPRLGSALGQFWALTAIGAAGWALLGQSAVLAGLTSPLCAAAFGLSHVGALAYAASASAAAILLHALAMAATMLCPGAIEPLAHVARCSFPKARLRHMAVFLLVFLGLWTAVALAIAVAAMTPALVGREARWSAALAAACWALVWQGTGRKRKAAAQCHGRPAIYSGGIAGLRSSAAFGLRNAGACVVSCAPLMAAAMLSPLPFPAMAGAAILIARERTGPLRCLAQTETAIVLAILAMVAALLLGLGF